MVSGWYFVNYKVKIISKFLLITFMGILLDAYFCCHSCKELKINIRGLNQSNLSDMPADSKLLANTLLLVQVIFMHV